MWFQLISELNDKQDLVEVFDIKRIGGSFGYYEINYTRNGTDLNWRYYFNDVDPKPFPSHFVDRFLSVLYE